jgi:hypothetical protein
MQKEEFFESLSFRRTHEQKPSKNELRIHNEEIKKR